MLGCRLRTAFACSARVRPAWQDAPLCLRYSSSAQDDAARNKMSALFDRLDTELGYFQSNSFIGSLVSETRKSTKQAKADLEAPFMTIVFGTYSAGKSTLINTLLGKKTCKVGKKPTTSELTFYSLSHSHLLGDSPGLNSPFDKEHRVETMKAATRANRALLVLSAMQPLGESELALIREINASNSKLVVAVNYWNLIDDDEEQEEVRDFVKEALGKLNLEDVPVEYINAKDAAHAGTEALMHQVRDVAGASEQKVKSAEAAIKRESQEMMEHLGKLSKLQCTAEEVTRLENKIADTSPAYAAALGATAGAGTGLLFLAAGPVGWARVGGGAVAGGGAAYAASRARLERYRQKLISVHDEFNASKQALGVNKRKTALAILWCSDPTEHIECVKSALANIQSSLRT